MRIVVRSPDARRARPLVERLESAGLEATALVGPAARRSAPGGEDVTILDGADPAQAIAFAQNLRDDGAPSLALVGACASDAPPPSVAARLDAWADLESAPETIGRRINRVFRDGVLSAEVVARARTAESLNLAPPLVTTDYNQPASVLFVGCPTPSFLALQRAMQTWGGRMGATFTSFSAFDHVHDDQFDALVLFGGDDAGPALSLIAALRRNSSLHDMPAYFLGESEDDRALALERGVDEAMQPRFEAPKAALWLIEDIRRARLRRALMRALDAPIAAPDEAFAFFGRHLAGLAQTHHDRGRPLSLAVLEANSAAIGAPAWRKGFDDILNLTSRLTRASDSVAPIDGQRIVLAFPSTYSGGAAAALQRVVSVCECTAFAAGDGLGAPVRLSYRVAELSPGESGAGLLSRAMLARAA